ncbi:serine/threonine-protein kinase [Microcoleus sp. CAWBG50]|nr:serine/threonine-protein kinase [Microcoleus sp. CAWBG50]
MIIGQTIGGRYHIKKSLSQGGFGETYVAEDTHLPGNPQFVVKKLNPQSTDPFVLQTAKRLFETESQVLYKLGKCDRIPQLFAHFEEDQEFYLVQELIVGHDLSQELVLSNQPGVRGTQLSENQVMQLLHDILEVLTVVHQEGVIHRDIKPANLMRRDSDDKIILIDFGAVKEKVISAVKNSQTQQNITICIGTEGYMPNEQMNGYPGLSSDIYAVGMVAIQALTGISPDRFPKDPDTLEVMWREQAAVSSKLADFIDNMIRYRHSDRYQSAHEALQVIKSLVSGSVGTTVISQNTGWKSLLANVKPKLKLTMGLIGLGIAVIAAVIVFQNVGKIQPQSAPTSTPTPAKDGVW